MKMSETYKDIEELIKILEKIREDGEGYLNFPQAIYLLALEIQKIKKGRC